MKHYWPRTGAASLTRLPKLAKINLAEDTKGLVLLYLGLINGLLGCADKVSFPSVKMLN